MNPDPQETDKDFGADLKTFDELPAKAKELHQLKDIAEKTIGKESVVLDRAIRAKAQIATQRLDLQSSAMP